MVMFVIILAAVTAVVVAIARPSPPVTTANLVIVESRPPTGGQFCPVALVARSMSYPLPVPSSALARPRYDRHPLPPPGLVLDRHA